MIDDWWNNLTPEARLRVSAFHQPAVDRVIQAAMEFDEAMVRVKAFSDLDGEELKEIAESARKLMRESPRYIGPDKAVRDAARPYYSGQYVSRKARREKVQS